MSKKKLKKEISRLSKIIDVLLKENRDVFSTEKNNPLDKEVIAYQELSNSLNTTTDSSYIGGRPNDRP